MGAVLGSPAAGGPAGPDDGALGAEPPPVDNDGPESLGSIGDDTDGAEPLELPAPLEPLDEEPELLVAAVATPVAPQINPNATTGTESVLIACRPSFMLRLRYEPNVRPSASK